MNRSIIIDLMQVILEGWSISDEPLVYLGIASRKNTAITTVSSEIRTCTSTHLLGHAKIT